MKKYICIIALITINMHAMKKDSSHPDHFFSSVFNPASLRRIFSDSDDEELARDAQEGDNAASRTLQPMQPSDKLYAQSPAHCKDEVNPVQVFEDDTVFKNAALIYGTFEDLFKDLPGYTLFFLRLATRNIAFWSHHEQKTTTLPGFIEKIYSHRTDLVTASMPSNSLIFKKKYEVQFDQRFCVYMRALIEHAKDGFHSIDMELQFRQVTEAQEFVWQHRLYSLVPSIAQLDERGVFAPAQFKEMLAKLAADDKKLQALKVISINEGQLHPAVMQLRDQSHYVDRQTFALLMKNQLEGINAAGLLIEKYRLEGFQDHAALDRDGLIAALQSVAPSF